MKNKVIVRQNEYYDSVFLMGVSEEIQKIEGINKVIVVMGTEMNKTILKDLNMFTPDVQAAAPNDLIIALESDVEAIISQVFSDFDNIINNLSKRKVGNSAGEIYRSFNYAIADHPEANLVFISVPGEYAALEARKAIEKNLHTFIFSDKVPLSEEVEIKQLAKEKGLLVMGPDCGTAVINGVSLGLMSKVREGSVGIVGASGSGIQEIAVLLDQMGLGISQAIGTGGRDLSEEVGGITMLQGIKLLEEDEKTKVIVLVSKPPAEKTMQKILAGISECQKPIVVNFLGGDQEMIRTAGACPALTLEETAYLAAEKSGLQQTAVDFKLECHQNDERIRETCKGTFSPGQKYLRGIFGGGTHCSESLLILRELMKDRIYSNVSFAGSVKLENSKKSRNNCLIDIGAEEFTIGRPHPVIDPTTLKERLLQEGKDPEVAVIILDVMLGYGAHRDPVSQIAGAIKQIKQEAQSEGRDLCIIASVCGTDQDPQGLLMQKKRLEEIGVIVQSSNAQATRLGGSIVRDIADNQ